MFGIYKNYCSCFLVPMQKTARTDSGIGAGGSQSSYIFSTALAMEK